MKPSTPLAIEIPKTIASATIAAAIPMPLTPSAISRPSTIELRGIGAARSLSK